MHRSASADFLSLPPDNGNGMQDDTLMLNDMYQKGNFALPYRGPGMDDSHLGMTLHEEPSSSELDLQNSMSFNTIDPSALSSDNHGL